MTADPRERLARVALSSLFEPASPKVCLMVARLGAVELYDRLLADPSLDDLRATSATRLAALDPAGVLDRARRVGIRYVVPGDDEWPAQLMDLDGTETLNGMAGAPLGLWVRGAGSLVSLCERSVAVVGSRSCTPYGEGVAGDISAHLTRAGRTVVSGAAFGIDTAAHRAALGSAGPTVAVLAGGVDKAYPVRNTELLREICRDGVVVSEALPGWAPARHRFLARNRLIAALTRGTVVVEAAVRSGALNTASWAGLLHRVVMGVPGPVVNASSEGVHELLHAGTASLVSRGEHVEDLVGAVGEVLWTPPRAPETLFDLLRDDDRRVLEAVPVASAAPLASIARTAGVPTTAARESLLRLQEEGWVLGAAGAWRQAQDPAARRSQPSPVTAGASRGPAGHPRGAEGPP
ncbi:DNA-processing protein DprA [Nocardioides marmoribigeumensis]|uniref:DNA processing protein n=1 Tax=Nocardioides marmoribigeumensis TaxID=433649 RepID=A0ABU2BS30_9ACTN|nr:DNA-processing protein DprA [Nocardioides marmoribigeumensis]MDR7361448.1 DNA processing protein [Nocardioides marmoribigeumensis]